MKEKIKESLEQNKNLIESVISDENMTDAIKEIIVLIEETVLKNKKKILLAGNGGSAADSQHIAAEFVNKFYHDRVPIKAIALTVDSSVITSIANDYSFDNIYLRQIEALGDNEDIFWAFSTSGESKNIIKAIEKANKLGLKTIGFTGGLKKNTMDKICEYTIKIPSNNVCKIQEMHIIIAHIICKIIEEKIKYKSTLQERGFGLL